MYNFLRRLELHGFKSFALKTVLEFPARVTAIVGPNGSGKSNIIDALRWIFGERDAKHLRGDTLGKLIFAGTPKRAAMGFARVAMYFDNREKIFPMDGEEIMLVKKIDRSGVSQYFLHEEELRLKDLVPLLARAKLGSRGLTMIGQGQSDIFVRSSPEERRLMIEEALGLREYRLKKNQAERQLEASEVNMDKVRAMFEELGPHLRLLRRQRIRWDKRSEIEQTLRELENKYFSHHYHSLTDALEKIDKPLAELEKRQHQKNIEIKAAEKELAEIDSKAARADETKTIREKLKKLSEEKGTLEKKLARTEARLEIIAARKGTVSNAAELIVLLKSIRDEMKNSGAVDSLETLKSLMRGWSEKIDEVLRKEKILEEEEISSEVKSLGESLRSIEEQIFSLREEEESRFLEREKLNREFRLRLEALENKKNELRRVEDEIQKNNFEKEKIIIKLDEISREWLSFGRQATELKSLPVSSEPVDSAEAERKMMRFRGELAAIGEIDQKLVEEAEESEKRYEFLKKELDDLHSAAADLKNLIRDLDTRIHDDFKSFFRAINDEFNNFFRLMFGGGRAHLKLTYYEPPTLKTETGAEDGEEIKNAAVEEKKEEEKRSGIEVELNLPRKKITSLDMLSGGEKSLVSIAALFALISVSPPPFLVLDEVDAPLDEENARRFAELVKEFAKKTQFIIVTHNRATMEAADVLYGITMGEDGVSKVLSLKLEGAVDTVSQKA